MNDKIILITPEEQEKLLSNGDAGLTTSISIIQVGNGYITGEKSFPTLLPPTTCSGTCWRKMILSPTWNHLTMIPKVPHLLRLSLFMLWLFQSVFSFFLWLGMNIRTGWSQRVPNKKAGKRPTASVSLWRNEGCPLFDLHSLSMRLHMNPFSCGDFFLRTCIGKSILILLASSGPHLD